MIQKKQKERTTMPRKKQEKTVDAKVLKDTKKEVVIMLKEANKLVGRLEKIKEQIEQME